MGDFFSTLDLVLFFTALVGVMAVGLIAGRKEETSEDYFLAGRKIPWWGVAGSIFGSNVSANHMVGMMGIGFSIGFAQSHFELGAVFGLLMLCYGFLPVYRKLRIYTLSEYLGRRYDDRSRLAYAVIMVLIMAVVQMVPGLYIGARTSCILLGGDAVEVVTVLAEDADVIDQADDGEEEPAGAANIGVTKRNVNTTYYAMFVIALAVISAAYTIFGGLKAVIWTDVMQSVLMLIAGIGIAVLTFSKIGGWGAMMAMDRAVETGAGKMHIYLPSSHPELPWTGVFTGLLAMHFFYWGTNQFIVQRALSARSDDDARLGIVAAGFLKMLIPFFAIGAGVAAFYVFRLENPGQKIDPDAAFSELVKLVVPVGFGLMGLIAAGVIGAILSSIDSMMNSAATIVTFDIYKRYINPNATDRQMIRAGRLSIVAFVVLAAWMAIFVLDPNSEKNFFLTIVDYQGYLTPGLLVAFFTGLFWRRSTATAAIVTIFAGIVFSGIVQFAFDGFHITFTEKQFGYDGVLSQFPAMNSLFGDQLNFFHRVVVVLLLCTIVQVVVSLMTSVDAEKSRLVWTDLGGHAPNDLRNLVLAIFVSIAVLAGLGWCMVNEVLAPTVAGVAASAWTFSMFLGSVLRRRKARATESSSGDGSTPLPSLIREDRLWAGLLCALAVFMHYYFY